MSVGDILYNLFIMPIEMIFEVLFRLFQDYPALGIFAISIVMNFLALPLYKRADAIQAEERDKAASMKPMLDIIKEAFKGDERYMITTTYYRQVGYKPLYALRSTFPLLLQIPFFIAAYHYLSNLELLKGVSLWIIKDLGAPDALISIGSFNINVLPVIMTLINVISAFIYLRGFPLKDKIQTYGIAAIFLVLLYDSPSGLVFYWTLNQVFSVCKNIVMKLLPKRKKKEKPETEVKGKKFSTAMFVLGGVFLAAITGLLIPSSVLSASPTEFAIETGTAIGYLLYTLTLGIGFFVIWFGIYYYLAKPRARRIWTIAVWVLAVVFAVDYMVFPNNFGVMSSQLIYDETPIFTLRDKLINLAVVIAVAAVCVVVICLFPKVVNYVYIIILIGTLGLSGVNVVKTIQTISSEKTASSKPVNTSEKVIKLSKNSENVAVIMLDREQSLFFPYIVQEKPELKEKFDGFEFYPNTVSFGMYTNYAAPALFGGYEYTPEEINRRDTEALVDKQNEALKVMPKLFSDEGYNVTVCDPPYAGYKWTADVSIYDDMENVEAYNIIGNYMDYMPDGVMPVLEKIRKRNFFMYSAFCVVPTFMRGIAYDFGNYLYLYPLPYTRSFLDSYAALAAMPDITEAVDEEAGEFLMMQNPASHEMVVLQTPEYEPVLKVTSDPFENKERYTIDGNTLRMETKNQVGSFQVNVAPLLKLADWMYRLKELGVYDNTRIIIVSDHGSYWGNFPWMYVWPGDLMPEVFTPLLMKKDFNAHGPLKDNNEFMSNADTVHMAIEGIVDNLVNPYTGKTMNQDAKKRPLHVNTAMNWELGDPQDTTLNMKGGQWWSIEKDIFDMSNWKHLDADGKLTP